MKIPPQKNVTSEQSLKSTILCDIHTYKWFLYLLSQPQVSCTLSNITEAKPLVQLLKKNTISQQIITIASILFIICTFISRMPAIIFTVILFCVIQDYFLIQKSKILVSKLSLAIIKHQFGKDLFKDLTLYQITSRLSKTNNITSLVNYQCNATNMSRNILITTFLMLATFHINKLPFFPVLIISFYLIGKVLLQTNLAYKLLK